METIYVTNEYKGYGKQNYYCYEYRLDGNTIYKIKCHRQKGFDGEDSYWAEDEKEVASWDINDPELPDWIHKYI